MTDTTLATEVDKLNCKVTIKFCDSIGGTPLVPLFMKNFSKLMEDGHAHYNFSGHNRCKAIYAEIDGKIVGHVVFEIIDDIFKTTWVILSAINTEYRRRGVYTMMHQHLEKQAKKLGSKKIASNVHVDNVAMKLNCEKLGRKTSYHRMEKELE